MQMLIAVAVMQRGHIHHPEMIREGSDQVDRLLEAVLDLEAQAVKINGSPISCCKSLEIE
jgi:hypothetical protein